MAKNFLAQTCRQKFRHANAIVSAEVKKIYKKIFINFIEAMRVNDFIILSRQNFKLKERCEYKTFL
jgi:hypothetical protein